MRRRARGGGGALLAQAGLGRLGMWQVMKQLLHEVSQLSFTPTPARMAHTSTCAGQTLCCHPLGCLLLCV